MVMKPRIMMGTLPITILAISMVPTMDGSTGAAGITECLGIGLSGTGSAVRPINTPANFRVLLTLDPYKATTVEVVIATTGGPSPTRWLVRMDRQTGVTFGKRVGQGTFEPAIA